MNEVVLPAPAAIRARTAALAGGVVQPLWSVCRRMRSALGVTAGGAIGVAIGTRNPIVTAVVCLAVAVVAMSIAWWPLTNPAFRTATELYYDHAHREHARWVAKMGGPMPRLPAEQEAWLAAHPDSPGRSGVLVALGRLAEANAVLDESRPQSADEAFELELDRQIHRLLGGAAIDLGPLRAAWAALPASTERDLRRECLAYLDAMVAVDQKRDPVVVLAAAGPEVNRIGRESRTPWLIARWSLIPLAFVALGILTAQVLS